MKQGNLRNCTKLRKSLLGNGELASLAYGSFKELHKIEEPQQGGLVVPFRSVLGDLWPTFSRSFTVRLLFVFGASSKAGIGPVCARDGFRPRLDARFMVYWTPVLWYTGRWFHLFVLAGGVHWTANAIGSWRDDECPRGEDRLVGDREAVGHESIRVERTPSTRQRVSRS
jgi:hypothetical protein